MFLKCFSTFFVVGCILNTVVYAQRDHVRPRTATRDFHPLKNEKEGNPAYWRAKASAKLTEKLSKTDDLDLGLRQAKNIILFLGDGMSVHTITAARNLMGDASEEITFEKFPYVGLSKTYCVDRQVADSACSSTAYLGGVKGNYGTIGVNANVERHDCKAGTDPSNFRESIAKWAQDAGKDAGFVTTARVTHASPAGVYAHTSDRNWESDDEIVKQNCSPAENVDIARQLVEWPVGQKLKVILGGGRRHFRNQTVNDEEGMPGVRLDGRDLIKTWLEQKKQQGSNGQYVWSRKGLMDVDYEKTDYLLGLFSNNHCPYHGDLKRKYLEKADPSLSEMTEAALKMLQKNPSGYFLFVEGAKIDMAHHDTRAHKALEDTVEFAKAVRIAKEMTSEDDTLIVVTSDHSHTMTINGYPYRSTKVTGVADNIANDNLPFTVLSYANGPGFYNTYSEKTGRLMVTDKKTDDASFKYLATAPINSETHGGEDVAVFASGPFARFFSGNYEQTNIPAMMARAANIGPFANIR